MRSSRSGPDQLFSGPRGFAHRGLHGDGVPENSLSAFRDAIDAGAGIECDVRMAADGIPIVFHDANLQRLCGVDRPTAGLHSHEALNYRLLETEECIPSLGDLLSLVGTQVPLLLELKTDRHFSEDLCEGVAECLNSAVVEAAVMSFDPRVGRWFARHAPKIRRGVVIGSNESALRRWLKLRLSHAQYAAVETSLVTTRWAQRLRQRMPLLTWTVRTAAQRETLANQADALIWEGDGRPRI
jgi:glycerophosphoryl diester phosphodiesterase